MAMQVTWQKSANRLRKQVLVYGMKEFGVKAAQKLNDTFEHTILLLAANPYMGERHPELDTPRRQYRTLVVHPHFKLVYYVDEPEQRLYITTLWDVRQAPATSFVSKQQAP